MDLLVIIGLAVGLSLDALAVSIANGYMIKQLKFHHAFRISAFFGFFQAVMPLAGWSAGLHFSSYIKKVDHWIAFCLLAFIGGKMIFESKKLEEDCESKNCTHFPTLLLLSLATSIDALAVGLSFAILNMSILTPIAIIGIITFTVCIIGVYVGNRLGHVFENKLELSGGIILVGIGIRILVEHLIKHI
jgi:putative Mn2+ efflux pump MntP